MNVVQPEGRSNGIVLSDSLMQQDVQSFDAMQHRRAWLSVVFDTYGGGAHCLRGVNALGGDWRSSVHWVRMDILEPGVVLPAVVAPIFICTALANCWKI